MNEYALAERAFKSGDAFKQASDPTTLGTPTEMRQYLENRLIDAYKRGVVTGEHIAAERVAKFVRGEKQ